MAASTHSDGTTCPEGTSCVPAGFTRCCDDFAEHTTTCYYDIRYEWHEDGCWVIAIPESAGGGGIEITFCPHCGARLSKRV